MKVFHLSDTHVGAPGMAARLAALVGHILAQQVDPARCVVVHTGDLVDHGAQAEARAAGLAQLERLRAAGMQVLLCPGNHDYGGDLGMDAATAGAYRQALGRFIFDQQAPAFPVEHRIGDHVFIGLDSCAAELSGWRRWFARGALGADQLARLDARLAALDAARVRPAARIVVYLHHHPFAYGRFGFPPRAHVSLGQRWLEWLTRPLRRLSDADALLATLRGRTHLLLFGHRHFGRDCSAQGRAHGVRHAFDASSSSGNRMGEMGCWYRMIDLDTDTISEYRLTA